MLPGSGVNTPGPRPVPGCPSHPIGEAHVVLIPRLPPPRKTCASGVFTGTLTGCSCESAFAADATHEKLCHRGSENPESRTRLRVLSALPLSPVCVCGNLSSSGGTTTETGRWIVRPYGGSPGTSPLPGHGILSNPGRRTSVSLPRRDGRRFPQGRPIDRHCGTRDWTHTQTPKEAPWPNSNRCSPNPPQSTLT
jgi:hypothetical protein